MSNQNTQGSSLSAILSTLAPTALISLAVFTVFLVARKRYDRAYQPRSYLQILDKSQLSPKPPATLFGWLQPYKALHDEHVLEHSSLDNYLWTRFFKMLAVMSFVGCLITWPILFPINVTGGGGQTGIDILSFSNVNGVARYFAQAIVSCLFLGFATFLIARETIFSLNLRKAYDVSPYNASRISSRTVLFVDVPESFRNEAPIRELMAGVKQVWLTHDVKKLNKKVEKHTDAVLKLEAGETKLVSTAIKKSAKAAKKNKKGGDTQEQGGDVLTKKDRPTHKLKPIIGKKVDTIEWTRSELHRLTPEIAREALEHKKSDKKQSAVFVEFDTVLAARTAMAQKLPKQAGHMKAKAIGMTPDSVKWDNIGLSRTNVMLKTAFGIAFMTFLCIFWAIPVAFVGILSNVNYLIQKVSFLSFINKIPPVILGVVTGLLPAVLLAVLMALVPIVAAAIAGTFEPTQKRVQMRVQNWYFPFQVIQVFLVMTITSGASAVVAKILQDPSQAPLLLAKSLPKASNFYICYFIVFGLMTSAMQFLNVVPLLFAAVLGKILDKTPRKQYKRVALLGGINWGATYPKFTLLGVIALSYSCIAPLVLGFATVGFTLLYLAFRYSAIFTLGTSVDTKGESYARALQQLMVGVYLSEVCLIGLFAIGVSEDKLSIGPLAIEVLLLIGTVVYHVLFRRKIDKMEAELPGQEHAHNNKQTDLEKAEHHPKQASQTSPSDADSAATTAYQGSPPAKPAGVVGKIKVFLNPARYESVAALGKTLLSPYLTHTVREFSPHEREEAYLAPALRTDQAVVWLARDEAGRSGQEVGDSRQAIGEGVDVTNEGAHFDEKGNVVLEDGYVAPASVIGSQRATGGYDMY